ncbi:hypothetical protein BU14_0176s0010 [Porphyra umbilicalis]|uniref:MPN domain-containing protein n=1 Tax=Porphyra umbilicalis TaxID=2786 RepID=A0A1X6P7D6_PORUM|nr:hypothetical protein BU14_0176s0010 [Porphyra umbilicalis]|eukprot:OSX76768.1 hypothetical protein BU14_0176s0010 [Porphyra umbilicalis]
MDSLFPRVPVLPVDASLAPARYVALAEATRPPPPAADGSPAVPPARAALLHMRVAALLCKTLPAAAGGADALAPGTRGRALVGESLAALEALAPDVQRDVGAAGGGGGGRCGRGGGGGGAAPAPPDGERSAAASAAAAATAAAAAAAAAASGERPPASTPPPAAAPRRRPPRRDGGLPLRPLHVNASLLRTFERMVGSATARGVRSVGVVAAAAAEVEAEGGDAALRVTALVVPAQTGTAESCSMVDVHDVYALHAAKGLVAVGWVHAIPPPPSPPTARGGDAAPSSPALAAPPPDALSGEAAHTQAAFQVALPEAAAVLLWPGRGGKPPGGGGGGGGRPRAPPRATVLRLAGGAGVAAVQACTERGPHEHPPLLDDGVTPLAVPADHVVIHDDSLPPFKIYDLRPLSAARGAAAAAAAAAAAGGTPPTSGRGVKGAAAGAPTPPAAPPAAHPDRPPRP